MTIAKSALALALLTTLACDVTAPLTPAPQKPQGTVGSGAAGETLKASAPTLVSPINNDVIPNEQPIFLISGATGSYASRPYFYEFQLTNDAGDLVRGDIVDGLQWALPATLGFNTAYKWRVRAALDGAYGPWSSQGRFFTPQPPQLPKPVRTSSAGDWQKWFEEVKKLRGVGPTVSLGGLQATRADLLAVEADWQNGWRGDLRARIFLPVPGCNPTAANNGNPPACAFDHTVDVGNIGQTWQWVVRY